MCVESNVFECDVCGLGGFRTKFIMNAHKKKEHTELFDFKCQICGDLFSDRSHLVSHISKMHKDIDKEAYYNEYLKSEAKCQYVHCGRELPLKAYSGNFCDQTHYECQRYIDNGVELKFFCSICNAGFQDIGSLQKHLGIIHDYTKPMQMEYYATHYKKDGEGVCLYCGKQLGLVKQSFSLGYAKFCHNKDCNVRYYNEKNNRHVVAGKSISNSRKENPHTNNSRIEHYTSKGLNEEDAMLALKDRQSTFTKEKCQIRYGKRQGLYIYNARQLKWQNVLKSKPIEERMRINRLKAYSIGSMSVAERELCSILGATQQLCISGEVGYVYDMYIGNKIIEYYGDYWHSNPKKYKPDFYNKSTRKTAQEKWDYDEEKNKFANSNGYDVLVIWESEYKANKFEVVRRCKEFLGIVELDVPQQCNFLEY